MDTSDGDACVLKRAKKSHMVNQACHVAMPYLMESQSMMRHKHVSYTEAPNVVHSTICLRIHRHVFCKSALEVIRSNAKTCREQNSADFLLLTTFHQIFRRKKSEADHTTSTATLPSRDGWPRLESSFCCDDIQV